MAAAPEQKQVLDLTKLHPELAKEAAPFNEREEKLYELLKTTFGAQLDGVTMSTITRFIRGYAGAPDPTQECIHKLEEWLKWRAEVHPHELRDAELEGAEKFHQQWLNGFHGLCKQGRPIYIDRIGSINGDEVFKIGLESVTKFHIQTMEQLTDLKEKLSQQYGRMMYRHVVIMDMEGFGFSHIASKFTEPIKAVVHIDQHYYPETLYRMIIVNAPLMFRMAWAMVRPWLHPETQNKIKVGSQYLKEFIDDDQLPRFLGGKCQCVGGKCLQVPFQDGRPRPAPEPQPAQPAQPQQQQQPQPQPAQPKQEKPAETNEKVSLQ